ncbi:hypothetical protein ACEPPN_015776 [Leptodophora sp. 'Broadleaf-Isolate-01']
MQAEGAFDAVPDHDYSAYLHRVQERLSAPRQIIRIKNIDLPVTALLFEPSGHKFIDLLHVSRTGYPRDEVSREFDPIEIAKYQG